VAANECPDKAFALHLIYREIELTQLHNHLMKSNPLLLPGGTVYILNLDSNVFRQ
jgi:hypothetical protein